MSPRTSQSRFPRPRNTCQELGKPLSATQEVPPIAQKAGGRLGVAQELAEGPPLTKLDQHAKARVRNRCSIN
jgi:hypothetical protein